MGLVGVGDTVDVPAGDTVDVLLVTLGSTEGLRVADEELASSLRRAGAQCRRCSRRCIPGRCAR